MRIGAFGWPLANAVMTFPTIRSDMRQASDSGKNIIWAGAKSAVKNNWQNLLIIGASRPNLLFTGLIALEMAPALTRMGLNYTSIRLDELRQSSVPFSQRYEHSQWASQHQQRGLASINGTRGFLGAEAAAFNSRYRR